MNEFDGMTGVKKVARETQLHLRSLIEDINDKAITVELMKLDVRCTEIMYQAEFQMMNERARGAMPQAGEPFKQ